MNHRFQYIFGKDTPNNRIKKPTKEDIEEEFNTARKLKQNVFYIVTDDLEENLRLLVEEKERDSKVTYDEQTKLWKSHHDPGKYDEQGGAKKVRKGSTPTCTSTGHKVTFTKDGKKVTRVVHENQRGTKVIKYNDAWVLLSKLKI